MVSASEIRRLFNDGGFLSLVRSGKLRPGLVAESHPSPPRASLPLCTRSQILAYTDEHGTKVAIVHQYVRPDGSIGASGLPDPKKLLLNGVLYVAG